jgi:LysM repeat protein
MSRILDALRRAQEEAERMRLIWAVGGPRMNRSTQLLVGGGVACAVAAVAVGAGWWLTRDERIARSIYFDSVKQLQDGQAEAAEARLELLATKYPFSHWADDALLTLGQSQQAAGRIEDAKTTYYGLVALYPKSPLIARIKKQLAQLEHPGRAPADTAAAPEQPAKKDTAAKPARVPPTAGESAGQTIYEVKAGDTLIKIARKFGVTVADIQKANGLEGTVIKRKQKLAIPAQASRTAPARSNDAS